MPHHPRWNRAARAVAMACACAWAAALAAVTMPAAAQQVLTVAAYPAVDEIVRAAIPRWKQLHPSVAVQVVSRQFVDHHTAMTTALSTSVYLPDVMALEVGYLGRFAQGGGLDDLAAAPYDIARFRAQWVPYAYQQATNRRGQVVAAPTDIGPGTLLYRADVLAKAGVSESDLTRSWDSYVATGARIKAATGAYLMAHARDMKDIVIRTGIQPGEGLYFDAQSRVLVNSPRFVRAFTLAREVRRQKLDAKVGAWSNEWSEGFKRGSIATQMTGAWLAGHLNNWLAPKTSGQWRAAPLPEGAMAAYALLAAQDDGFFEQPIAFLGGQTARVGWRAAARRITAVDVHKQDAFASEVIDTELDLVLDRGKPIATALADAERLLQQRAKR